LAGERRVNSILQHQLRGGRYDEDDDRFRLVADEFSDGHNIGVGQTEPELCRLDGGGDRRLVGWRGGDPDPVRRGLSRAAAARLGQALGRLVEADKGLRRLVTLASSVVGAEHANDPGRLQEEHGDDAGGEVGVGKEFFGGLPRVAVKLVADSAVGLDIEAIEAGQLLLV
jgi:hypothetical protein